ncbi:Pycsar system effector family protein [Sinorhizobium meliloti]|uniref:Pycsar system effector family protein n=1 Tax=Rhizobium meliloti TaxID=382 RepID=UPI0012978346|nr:Pycsar system effector family protein [Sinorhizobium meliloti]MQX70033.1 hypothetical protein [Sinorhizobium meliloti]
MKNDQQEAYERVLTSTLGRVIDFLKFAEAKNAALLTFASAWILASVNLLNGSNGLSAVWRIGFTFALPVFVGAAILALCSFLPKTLLSQFYKDPEQTKALLYFGDAATFEPAAYRERIRERYFPPEGESATRNYLDDLSVQITVNSQITTSKLKLFNTGALFVLLALLILAFPAVITLCRVLATIAGSPDGP